MPNNNRLKRIYNLKKKSKEQEDKAYELGDGYHQDMPGSTPKQDRKMMRHVKRSEKAGAKAEKLWDKHQAKEDEKWTDQALYGKGGYELPHGESPLGYTAPMDAFAVMEEEDSSPIGFAAKFGSKLSRMGGMRDHGIYGSEEEDRSSPIGYVMDGAKVKDTSPNQGFSTKDFHLIQKLQGNYKEPSEGSFKTNSQNIYSSFDSPLEFRGMNPEYKRDTGPTRAKYALAAADRRVEQNKQGLANAATVVKMGTDLTKMVMGFIPEGEGE